MDYRPWATIVTATLLHAKRTGLLSRVRFTFIIRFWQTGRLCLTRVFYCLGYLSGMVSVTQSVQLMPNFLSFLRTALPDNTGCVTKLPLRHVAPRYRRLTSAAFANVPADSRKYHQSALYPGSVTSPIRAHRFNFYWYAYGACRRSPSALKDMAKKNAPWNERRPYPAKAMVILL